MAVAAWWGEASRRVLAVERVVAQDGDSTTYTVVGDPQVLVKSYRVPSAERADKLAAMLGTPPQARQGGGSSGLAWPFERVVDAQGACVGYVMPRVDFAATTALAALCQPGSATHVAEGFTWPLRLRATAHLAGLLESLHVAGYVAGTLNGQHVLAARTGQVSVVHCDQMQVRQPGGGVFHAAGAGPEFTPPELRGEDLRAVTLAPYHDNFALAVLIYLLLLDGSHPFAGVAAGTPWAGASALDLLPGVLRNPMRQCFEEGAQQPQRRPNARDWRLALGEAEQHLRQCPANPLHWYSDHLEACPWCARGGSRTSARSYTAPGVAMPPPWTPPPLAEVVAPSASSSTGMGRRAFLIGGAAVIAAGAGGGALWAVQSGLLKRLGLTLSPGGPAATSTAVAAQATRLPQGATLQSMAHPSVVVAVAWSPNGRQIVTACQDGTARVWDVRSGQQLVAYQGHAGPVWTVDWSPSGDYIASGGADNTVQVWHAADGALAYTFTGHTEGLETVAWSPDSQRVASASDDQTVQVWDALSGNNLLVYRGHTDWAYTVSWSPDGGRIVSGGKDSTVQVWDASSGALVQMYRGHSRWVNIVAWAPSGAYIASGSDDRTVQVWQPESGALVQRFHGPGQMIGATWSPDSQLLATSDFTTGAVQVWQATSGSVVFTYRGHSKPVRAVAWSHTGQQLTASVSEDHTAKVWQAM